MSYLGEERNQLTSGFGDWLVKQLGINEDSFSGMSYIRGGQANFDRMGWDAFLDLLKRNRRACRVDPGSAAKTIREQFEEVAGKFSENRTRFGALDAAIDRIVWQLVGLNSDGSLPP